MTCPICPRPLLKPHHGRLPITFVADCLNRESTRDGAMMVGRDAHMLARQLTRLGFRWSDFGQTAACWSAQSAARRRHAALTCTCGEADMAARRGHFFIPLGDGAFEKLTGLRLAEHLRRGYVFPERRGLGWVLPVMSPNWYRANPQLLLTFLMDMEKAVRLSHQPFEYERVTAHWQPSPSEWHGMVREFLLDPRRLLAADIETPWKRRADMSEEEKASDEDVTYQIDEVNLAWSSHSGVSVPWTSEYQDGVLAILRASQERGTTLFWNAAYDVPRLKATAGVSFDVRHTRDTMDAWHCLYNGLPRRLVTASSLLACNDYARPWKHLGTDDPFYRAMDVIALWRNDVEIRQQLKSTGAWPAYELFFERLDPLLVAMTDVGIGVSAERVETAATEGAAWLAQVQAEMTAAVPPAALNTHVWKKREAAEKGLERMKASGEVLAGSTLEPVPATMSAKQCGKCGEVGVGAVHVRRKTLGGVV